MTASDRHIPRMAAPSAARWIRRARTWTIYAITETATGRRHVGRTDRTVPERALSHWYRSGRRMARFRRGSLAEAMRSVRDAGGTLGDSFAVEILETMPEEEAARIAERDWIAHLDAAVPRGFNRPCRETSPGGSSRPRAVVLTLPDGSGRTFASVAAAHGWCADARSRASDGTGARPPLPDVPVPSLPLVYDRLAAGWRMEEALGLRAHNDLRGVRRTPLVVGGRRITRLRDASGAGRSETLRWRAHRARRAGVEATADLLQDRRRCGAPRAAPRAIRLPHPARPGGPRTLGGRAFALAAGMSDATLRHRLRGLEREGRDVAAMPGRDLVARLGAGPGDRRRVVRVDLPDGRTLQGGLRELARRVAIEPTMASVRAETLSEEGIRGRLRKLPADPSNTDLLRALGLRERAGTPSVASG